MTEHSVHLGKGESARLREWMKRPDGAFGACRLTIEPDGAGGITIVTWPGAEPRITGYGTGTHIRQAVRKILADDSEIITEAELMRRLGMRGMFPSWELVQRWLLEDEEAGLVQGIRAGWSATAKTREAAR